MTTINVIDAPCGKGKTSWAIQHINQHPDQKFLFITPFLDEVDRIKKSCPGFKEPTDTKGSKTASLKDLLDSQHNIVSTHSLFSMADEEVLDLLRLGKYTLILDEVMDVVKRESISGHDIRLLIDGGWVEVDTDTGLVKAVDRFEPYQGKFHDIIDKARANRLIYFNNTFLVWEFSPEFFKAMREVYILTYLFRGQIQRCYFDFHQMPYEMLSVAGAYEDYYTIPFDPDAVDLEFRQFAKNNINVYEGKLNDIGDKGLGFDWYKRRNIPTNKVLPKIQKEVFNYFHNILKAPAKDNMWTCFKDTKDRLKGKGYTKGYVQPGARATNDYRHKKNLAYLINRYSHPALIQYFESQGVKLDQNLYAVSELIQWVWRSQIRDHKPINIYMPSKRMRNLFREWMDGELETDPMES
jgi:hypothetical protein